jgi:opacity protein-like surface antigen
MGRCKSDRLVILCLALAVAVTCSTIEGAPANSTWPPPDPAPMFHLSLSGPPDWLTPTPSPDPAEGTATPSPSPTILQGGTWDLEFSGAHMGPFKSKRDYFDSGSTALGYFIADSFSVNAALVGYSINQPDNCACAGGFDLYARYYFLTLDRFTFYFDAGAGVFIADKEVPEHGTHFNFTPRSGFGVGYHLSDRVYLLAGVRYWHLSNAGIDGRNPSFDSLQYYGSIMFTF